MLGLPGASGVSPTFLRFGSFQIAAKRGGAHGLGKLSRLALAALASLEAEDDTSMDGLRGLLAPARDARDAEDAGAAGVPAELCTDCFFARHGTPTCAANYAVRADEAAAREGLPVGESLACLLERVTLRSASLVAAWMAAGFAHGVMNTDNMSILGITIDLNVFGFMGPFDHAFTANHIDDEARYAFGKQARAMQFNLRRLADAFQGKKFPRDREADAETWFLGLDPGAGWLSDAAVGSILGRFWPRFAQCYTARMRLRIGLQPHYHPPPAQPGPPADHGTRHTSNDEHAADEDEGDDDDDDDDEDGDEGGHEDDTNEGAPPRGDSDLERAAQGKGGEAVALWLAWLAAGRADYPRASRMLPEVAPLLAAVAADTARTHLGASLEAAAESLEGLCGVGQRHRAPDSDARRALLAFLERLLLDLCPACGGTGGRAGPAAGAGGCDLKPWAARVRAAAPRYVLRSRFVRQLSIAAAEDATGGGDAAVDDALKLLQQPFDAAPWRPNTRGAPPRKDAGHAHTREAVEHGLGALEDEIVTTSCGGQ